MALGLPQRHDHGGLRADRFGLVGSEHRLTDTQWLVDPDVAYLNHGGYGALPRPVADAAEELRATVEGNPSDLLARQWQDRIKEGGQGRAAVVPAPGGGVGFVSHPPTRTAAMLAALA